MTKKEIRILIIESFLAVFVGLMFIFPDMNFLSYNKSSALDSFIVTLKSGVPAPKESKTIKLIAVGDIMLSRGVDMKMEKNGQEYPFIKVKDYLKTGDIVFGNLESPIFPGEVMPVGSTVFWARPGIEKQLKDAGFNVMSLANNHMGNQGTFGVNYTVYSLTKEGILPSGGGRDAAKASAPAVIERNGIKIAFLSYTDGAIIPDSYEATEVNPGVVYMDHADLKGDIEKAKTLADFVIVSMHAGTEYVNRPIPKQISFAREAIDNGAEMVIGHHPHNIQDIEQYNGKYIFYSLGNFIFDQMWSEGTRQGMIAEIIINKEGVQSYHLTPIRIDDFCQPNMVDEEEGTTILSQIIH